MEELMAEAKPLFDHRSMITTVRDVLLNGEAGLRSEDKTSLLASIAEPSPRPATWEEYLMLVVDAGLPDAVYSTLCADLSDEDVVLFALHTFSVWLDKDVPRAAQEIHALRGLPAVLLEAARRHGRNVMVVHKALGVFLTLPDDILSNRETLMPLAREVAEVLAGSHQHGTYAVWQTGCFALFRLLSVMLHNMVEWQLAEPIFDLVKRLLEIAERNASHWEVFYVLQILSSFKKPLEQHAKLTASVCSKIILSHTAGGTECTDRRVCTPDYEKKPNWGATIDMALKIMTSLCFREDLGSNKDVVTFVLLAGRANLNFYLPGRSNLEEARKIIHTSSVELMCASGAVRACTETILSHPEYRTLTVAAVTLLMLLTYGGDKFVRDDLYRSGSGAFALLEMISSKRSSGLGSHEANEMHDTYIANASALLMLLTSERRYKMGILGRGYEQIWALVQTPDTQTLGLTALCMLAMNSPDAQEWLRKRGTDRDLMHLFRDPMSLVHFKMTVDVLAEMQSPSLLSLPEEAGLAHMVAIIFYFTPRLSTTELTRDSSNTVTALLKAITQRLNAADKKNDATPMVEELAGCGYALTLVLILWNLDADMAIWKEAATAAFYFFMLEECTPLDTVQKWLLHMRATAEETDLAAKRYRKMLESGVKVPVEDHPGPRSVFWEAVAGLGMQRRKLVMKEKYGQPPRNDLVVEEKKVKEVEPTLREAAVKRGQAECSFCGRIPTGMGEKLSRCARCQKKRYCSKDCQLGDWKRGHSKECVKIDQIV